MAEEQQDLEPLFDYTRVQPPHFFTFDDSDIDNSEIFLHCTKKSKKTQGKEGLKGKGDSGPLPEEKDNNTKKENNDDDWLTSPPPKTLTRMECEDDSILRELRLRKEELALLFRPVEDELKDVIESAKKQVKSSKKTAEPVILDLPSEVREKIVISIQDKDGKKQFCIYKDDKFEKLFKIYAKKVNLKPEDLIFSFDGEKVGPASTPVSLELEDDDILEVHVKSS